MSIRKELEQAGVCFNKKPYIMVNIKKVSLKFTDEGDWLEYRLHGKTACSVAMSGDHLKVGRIDFDIPSSYHLACCFVDSVKMQYRNSRILRRIYHHLCDAFYKHFPKKYS